VPTFLVLNDSEYVAVSPARRVPVVSVGVQEPAVGLKQVMVPLYVIVALAAVMVIAAWLTVSAVGEPVLEPWSDVAG
jgi:hypothetical protein